MDTEKDITRLLFELNVGSQDAYDQLFPLVYEQLRVLAGQQIYFHQRGTGQTWSKTDLVHEAYLKLVANPPNQDWKNRAHFFGIAARCMRSIMIDYARKKSAEKRGGHQKAITYIDQIVGEQAEPEYLIELDEALEKLVKFNERLVRIVELRYFTGMNVEETAEILNISASTVKRDWAKARGWLYRELKTN